MMFCCVNFTKWMHQVDTGKTYREKLDGYCTRMLQVKVNKSWKQHHTKQLLYGYLPTISSIIQIRRTIHTEYWWKSKDEF